MAPQFGQNFPVPGASIPHFGHLRASGEVGAAGGAREAPQFAQNLTPGVVGCPHFGQGGPCAAAGAIGPIGVPQFGQNRTPVADVVRSVREAAAHFDSISVNPVHIQNGTVVEWLYHRGRYRPPWLWSLVDALQEGAAVRGSSRLVSFPTAGGLARGPHNCGSCDARVLAAIQEASLSQEFALLDELDCPCRAQWRSSLAYMPLGVEA